MCAQDGLNLKRPTPMKKKPPVLRFQKPKAVFQSDERSWHNGGDIEIGLYARSLHQAAKTLIAALDVRRQLLLWIDDNYFSVSTTITS
jgi:hypothetical protein